MRLREAMSCRVLWAQQPPYWTAASGLVPLGTAGVCISALCLVLFIRSTNQHRYLACIFYNVNLWERERIKSASIPPTCCIWLPFICFCNCTYTRLPVTCLPTSLTHAHFHHCKYQNLLFLQELMLTTWNSYLYFLLLICQRLTSPGLLSSSLSTL